MNEPSDERPPLTTGIRIRDGLTDSTLSDNSTEGFELGIDIDGPVTRSKIRGNRLVRDVENLTGLSRAAAWATIISAALAAVGIIVAIISAI